MSGWGSRRESVGVRHQGMGQGKLQERSKVWSGLRGQGFLAGRGEGVGEGDCRWQRGKQREGYTPLGWSQQGCGLRWRGLKGDGGFRSNDLASDITTQIFTIIALVHANECTSTI